MRTALLDSEDNECPDCNEKGSSPGSLIPNRFLRNSVNAFKNETGYIKPRQERSEYSLAILITLYKQVSQIQNLLKGHRRKQKLFKYDCCNYFFNVMIFTAFIIDLIHILNTYSCMVQI